MICSSYLVVMHLLRARPEDGTSTRQVISGEYGAAAMEVKRRIGEAADERRRAHLWSALGYIRVLEGDFEAAEQAFARCLPLLQRHPDELDAVSCRSTGLLMLVRGKMETAARCLGKNIHHRDEGVRWEALSIMALILKTAGLLARARLYARRLLEESAAAADMDWQAVASTILHELETWRDTVGAEALRDHVYWSQSRCERAGEPVDPAAIRSAPRDSLGLILGRRLDHLGEMLALARGERVVLDDRRFGPPLRWPSHDAWRDQLQRQELALAAIAGGRPCVARTLLSSGLLSTLPSVEDDLAVGVCRPARIEYAYCMARIFMAGGRMQEGLSIYRAYLKAVLDVMRHLGETLEQVHACDWLPGTGSAPVASVPEVPAVPAVPAGGDRLPHRYRIAYDYARTHCDRIDLGVHEVAATVGVSERALQQQFQRSLGVTPRELIRQFRAGVGA